MESRSRNKLDELMRSSLIFPVLIFFSCSVFGQDSSWIKKTVDENLTISFPGATTQVDTLLLKNGEEYRFRAYRYQDGYNQLAVVITPNETKINADNPESLEQALAGAAKGAENSLRQNNISCITTDTTIDNFRSKKMTCNALNGTRIISYMLLVNDKLYLLQSAFSGADEEKDRVLINKFLSGARFTKAPVKEKKFGSKAESLGYKIGKIALPALLIIGLIIFFVKRSNK